MRQAPAARPRATCRHRREDQVRFCIADDDVLALADAAIEIEDHYSRKAGAADADGHRMGQGRRGRPALHRAGASRDRRIATAASASSMNIAWQARREVRVSGRAVGGRIAAGKVARRSSDVGAARRVPAGRGARGRHDHARLGHGDESSRRGRHQPRRAHLPRRHRGARAGHSGRGRLRRRDDEAAHRRRGHRVLRRRCRRAGSTPAPCRSRCSASTCRRSRARRPI